MKTTHLIVLLIIGLAVKSNTANGTTNISNTLHRHSNAKSIPINEKTTTASIKRIDRFVAYQENPQQKLYVQTDKDFYSAGEKIWFAAFLVEAVEHQPTYYDQFIYVDLFAPDGSVAANQIIRRDSTGFNGMIPLPVKLHDGQYTLRAYSRQMNQSSPDFLFHKPIRIANPILSDIQSSISFTRQPDNKQRAEIRFIRNNKEPLASIRIKCRIRIDENKTKEFSLKTDNDGVIGFDLDDETSDYKTKVLECQIEDAAIEYQRNFVVPPSGYDFDLTFHPEGGDRIQGLNQIVAFKAIDNRGRSIDVQGVIVSDQGDTLSPIQSEHDGMGMVLLYSGNHQPLTAVVRSNGLEKRFALPRVNRSGIALSVKQNKENISLSVQTSEDIKDAEPITLLAHTRGYLWFERSIPSKNSSLSIPINGMSPGILHLIVIRKGQPVAERLCFIAPKEQPTMRIDSLKASFNPKSEVKFTMQTDTILSRGGWFAMSVTDNRLVESDSLSDNIRSYLWLSSDLKGYVENPRYYLRQNDPLTAHHTDLLMLTHGWRRFDVGKWEMGESVMPIDPEISQRITGRVVNVGGKGTTADITAVVPETGSVQAGKTDDEGRFEIGGLDIPDSTIVMIQAFKKRMITLPIVKPDTVFTVPSLRFHYPDKPAVEHAGTENYLQEALATYYEEGGVSTVSLKETVVTARKQERLSKSVHSMFAQGRIFTDESPDQGNISLGQLIGRLPGVMYSGGISGASIKIRNATPRIFVVDGFTVPSDQIDISLPANIYESVEVVKGPAAAFWGEQGGNGVIIVSSKKGEGMPPKDQPNFAYYKAKGYEKKVQFYHPKYETDKPNPASDRRTTLYWNPDLRFDENGNTSVSFFTADRKTDYRIVVEGIGSNGAPLYFEHRIIDSPKE